MKNAATARVAVLLGSGDAMKSAGAKQQLEPLDERTLVQLWTLLAETKKGGSPAN